MTSATIAIALLWGAVSGLLGLHLLANLLAMIFCLHGLLTTRWKRLARKATIGAIKYGINLKLLLRVSIYALLFAALLYYGDRFVRREFRFQYRDNVTLLYAAAATLAALSRLKTMWKRSQLVWRMSHEVDYAERRQRTRMLKS